MVEDIQQWIAWIEGYLSNSRAVGALVILLAFLIAAKIADFFFSRLILSLVKKTRFKLDDTLVTILHRPVRSTIVLIGAIWAVRWIGPKPVYAYALLGAIGTLLTLIWALALNAIFRTVSENWTHHLRETGRQGLEIVRLIENIGRVAILVGAVFLFLSIWNINITPLLASAGIAGIALALAAKETLSNFFGGINVYLDQPYRTGDYIVLDSGERGEVVEIGLRSTRIMTRDDVQISIPNAIIANTKIINESAPEPRFRVRIKLGVAYGTDVDKLEALLLDLARNNPLVTPEPAARVRFRAFGDSSLDFELLCWANRPHDKGLLTHELNRSIYKALNEAGITIPFPQRDVHVYDHQSTFESE
jgi:small-conductance mechanosensitive channel